MVDEVIVLGEEIDLRCTRSGSTDARRSIGKTATANAFQFIRVQFTQRVNHLALLLIEGTPVACFLAKRSKL